MFIMKAGGVLDVPWVAPNKLHVTGWRGDSQQGAIEEEKTHTHTHLIRMQLTPTLLLRSWFFGIS